AVASGERGGEKGRSEGRVPIRVLRRSRFSPLNSQRSRAAAPGSTAGRFVGNRPECVRLLRLFPDRRQPVFRSSLGRRSRIPTAVRKAPQQERQDERTTRDRPRFTEPASVTIQRHDQGVTKARQRPTSQ